MPIHENVSTKKRNGENKKPDPQKKTQIVSIHGQQLSISLTDLPSNVLVEILARLPLRTLFVARSVCKTFGSLSTPNPHFINLHSSNAAQIPIFQFKGFNMPSYLIHMGDQVLNYKKSHLRPLFQFPKIVTVKQYNITYFRDIGRLFPVNSCNGLLYFSLIWIGDTLSLVCNPVTNEYITIPAVVVDPKIRIYPLTQSFCLGFSPVANQYKVLRIFIRRRGDDYDVAAQVYVIGSDSWRDIDDTPPLRRHFIWNLCQTEHVNGVMYWYYGGSWPGEIISFDFEGETFEEVALPPKFQDEGFITQPGTSIGVLGGCLCFSCNNSDANRVDLWMMRKCGNHESWTRDFVFYTEGLRVGGGSVNGQFKPLQFLGNGDILMQWTHRQNALVCYDPRTVTLRHFVFDGVRGDYKVMALTPSFVPLKDTLKVEKVLSGLRPRGDQEAIINIRASW